MPCQLADLHVRVVPQGTQPVPYKYLELMCGGGFISRGCTAGTALLLSALSLINTLSLMFQIVSSANKSPQQSTVLTIQGSLQAKNKCPVSFPKEKQVAVQFHEPSYSSFLPLPIT